MNNRPAWILPIIIFSQFTGTSLWFAGNAIIADIQRQWFFIFNDFQRVDRVLSGRHLPGGNENSIRLVPTRVRQSAGFLVGALVARNCLTAPFEGIRSPCPLGQTVIVAVSLISASGGGLMYVRRSGRTIPFHRAPLSMVKP